MNPKSTFFRLNPNSKELLIMSSLLGLVGYSPIRTLLSSPSWCFSPPPPIPLHSLPFTPSPSLLTLHSYLPFTPLSLNFSLSSSVSLPFTHSPPLSLLFNPFSTPSLPLTNLFFIFTTFNPSSPSLIYSFIFTPLTSSSPS